MIFSYCRKALAKATKSAGAAATRIKLADDLVNEWKAELEAFKKRYHCKPQTDHKLDDINRLVCVLSLI